MRRKTLLNRNVIIVLMLFIFLMTAFVSTAYSLWYFPNSGNPKEVNADMKVDDIEENFKDTGSYLKIIDCRDGVIPTDADFAKSKSGFLDNLENFTDNDNTFRGKKGEDGKYRYSKKVFSVPSLNLNSFVSSVFYRSSVFYGSDTSETDEKIYLYDLLNSKYKLVDHLTNENIELRNKNGTSSEGGDMGEPLDAKSYSSTKFEDYRKNIGYPFSKSRILFLVPRNTETPPTVGDYNIYFHNEATGGDDKNSKDYSKLDHVWLWNDRTDFGVSLPLTGPVTKDGTIYNKSLQINYETFYEACNDFKGTKQSRFIMTPQTAPTGIIFKTGDGTNFAPKDGKGNIEYLALPLPPKNSTSFDIYINAAKDGKFTIKTKQDVDLTKNKNIVFYSKNGLDHLWMWPLPNDTSAPSVWISSNYVYQFETAGFDKPVSCFSYNYGEKFNFYKNWKGPDGTMPDGTPAQLSLGFTFDKNYKYNQLKLVKYGGKPETDTIDISGLFDGTSECTSVYLIVNDKNEVTKCTTSKDDFIKELNKLN